MGADLQRHYERLVLGLEELTTLGSQRLSLLPSAELHTRDRLEALLSSHTVGGSVVPNLWVGAPTWAHLICIWGHPELSYRYRDTKSKRSERSIKA